MSCTTSNSSRGISISIFTQKAADQYIPLKSYDQTQVILFSLNFLRLLGVFWR
jgi:hypothetical protein